MENIKVITKEYGSKSEAAYKILNQTQSVVIPHLVYLLDFLNMTGQSSFYVGIGRNITSNNGNLTLNTKDSYKITYANSIRIFINFDERTFRTSNNNNDNFIKFERFKSHISDSFGDTEKIAICDGFIRYTGILQDELWEIEMMDNKINIFKKTLAKREVLTEKHD